MVSKQYYLCVYCASLQVRDFLGCMKAHGEIFFSSPFLHIYPMWAPLATRSISQQKRLPSSWLHPIQELFHKLFYSTLLFILWNTHTRTHTYCSQTVLTIALVAFGTSQIPVCTALCARLQTGLHCLSIVYSATDPPEKTYFHYRKNLQECSDKDSFFFISNAACDSEDQGTLQKNLLKQRCGK